ncbi:MAG: VOC family protein [Thermoplasmata archaeon]|jgi:lactoylglutathione lyase
MTKPTDYEFSRVRILVRDFPTSWRFYRDVLGLTPVQGHGEGPYGEFLTGRQAIVSLFDRKLMESAVGTPVDLPKKGHASPVAVVFEVPSVDRTARRLRGRRVRVVQGPTDRPDWGLRTIHLLDPDGNLIEIYSSLKSRH